MIVQNGSTDITTYVVLRDATTHAPKDDITVTDLDLYYCEELKAMSSKVDATALAAATSAHADNKAFHCGLGRSGIVDPERFWTGFPGGKTPERRISGIRAAGGRFPG